MRSFMRLAKQVASTLNQEYCGTVEWKAALTNVQRNEGFVDVIYHEVLDSGNIIEGRCRAYVTDGKLTPRSTWVMLPF